MDEDVSKLLMQQPQIVVERTLINHSPLPQREERPFNEPAHHAENFGGQFVTASGTSVSPSAPPDEYVYYISDSRPLPEIELQKQHVGRNMELVTNPSKNK
jgi:hypothetical protein